MYRVETHNNSKDYFKRLLIEKNSFHVASNTALSNMIKERARCLEEDKWRILDIENLIKTIYKEWNSILNQIKLRAEVRKIIVELKGTLKIKEDVKELLYFEDNFDVLIEDINLIASTNLTTLIYEKDLVSKKIISLIYNKLVCTDCFKQMSQEILNPIKAKEFYKNLKEYKESESIHRIYFYNINYLDLKRFLIIDLLQQAGFQIIFRIPYFKSLDRVNTCWDVVYGDKNLFSEFEGQEIACEVKPKYVSFLQGDVVQNDTKEKVIIKTYREVVDFKRELEGKKVITFYKDSLAACMNKENYHEEHCFQTAIGRFLFNLYNVEIVEEDVRMSFQLYRELITSGWMEYKNWNGARLSEYLTKNEDYFNDCKTIDQIIERINKLRELEEVNEIFEEQVKLRIKGDEQKRFLSNPFRAFGYNNTDKSNITSNYMLEVTMRLKRFILKALASVDGLIDINEHFELLKLAFRNNYIFNCNTDGTEIEKITTRKIWGVLNNANQFGDRIHKEELRDLFSVTLKINSDETEERDEESDFSIDQLEGIILRDRMTQYGDRNVIFISDMSFSAYEKYVSGSFMGGKILRANDFEDILLSSLTGKNKDNVVKGLKLENRSNRAKSSYIKYLLANLFINFSGEKEFSWIEGLRDDDSKAIVLNQIESIYELKSEVKEHLLDFEDIIEESEIAVESQSYDVKDLNKNYGKYSDVAYRDLDFCSMKFLYSSVINSYPMYYSGFHQKLVFAGLISVLKSSMDNSYKNIAAHLFPLFPQWADVVKSNILTCEYARKSIRDYKYFEGINYPKTIDSIYLLKSKYIVGENWKIKSRYNKETFKAEAYYKEFLEDITSGNACNNGAHCCMCPHIYLCRKGEFLIDNK